MARAIWTGALAFGLVNVPVGLFSATEDKTVHFHQFAKGTSSRIRLRRVNEDTGEEVPYDDVVQGYDVGGGEYVMVEPEELEAVEPGRTRTIEISDFVDAAEVDPIYYQKTYYLAPKDEAAERAYALLAHALEKAGRVGIATFVMRSKQYLAAVRPKDGVLTLETMFFADEVRDPAEEIDRLPVDVTPRAKDLDMAVSLIDTMTTTWEPTAYRDTYRDAVMDLIEAKRRGEEVVAREAPAEGVVVDLLEALQRSVAAAQGRRSGGGSGGAASSSGASSGGTSSGASGKAAAGKAKKSDDDLAGRSRDELYALAQELDVDGRSTMTKDQLAEAVRAARSSSSRRRAS